MGDGADGVFLFILIFATIVLVCMVAVGVYVLFHESKAGVAQLYVRGTGALPLLICAKGIVYHLFLSHIWNTGEFSCRARIDSVPARYVSNAGACDICCVTWPCNLVA